MVVDDNEDNRVLLVQYLESLGFTLREAGNGSEALAIARSFQPEVILVDLLMPVMDGKTMVERVRQDSLLKDVIIFMVSANTKLIVDSVHVQCEGFLAKPLILGHLLELLEQHLSLDWQIAGSELKPLNNFPAPDRSELLSLLELVDFGDMNALLARMDLLQVKGDRYDAFIQEVRRLAENCQQGKLEQMLESMMVQGNNG